MIRRPTDTRPSPSAGPTAPGVVALMVATLACAPAPEDARIELPPITGTTLIGTPLREPAWSPETRAALEQDLAIARAVFEVAPEREDSWIWLGRRYGYLGRNPEAIDVFTRGIAEHPDSYKLYRFRARHRARHRQFEPALDDYRQAAELMEGHADTYEPDGIINARNQFIGSYRSNIDYYTGQTSWAVGDYQAVIDGMTRAAGHELGNTPDRLASTTYWRYLAHRKLGNHAAAAALLDAVPDDLDIIESFTYDRAVQFLRGRVSREDALDGGDAVIRFAVAMSDLFAGDTAQAEALLRDTVERSALGFWPAEVELVALEANR